MAVVERWPLSEVRLYKDNGRSFRRDDFWDKLVGKALVMIGRWYSRHNRQPIIGNAYPSKWSQKSLRRKLVPIPLIVHKDLFILSKGQLKASFYPDFSLAFAKACGTGKAGRLFNLLSFPLSFALLVSSLRLVWCESRSAREGRCAKGTLEENSKNENKKRNFKIVYNSNWISCYLRSLMINYG